MTLSSHPVLRTVKEYIFITVGLMIYAFSWTAVVIPADGVGGGASGVALLIYYATGGANGGIPIGYSFFAVNGILLLIAALTVGIRFGAKTIYAIVVISFGMGLMQKLIPPDLLGLGGDKLLSAILGGALGGLGISICFTQGGSTGGTDIVAMIVNKYYNISYGKIMIVCDMVIIGCSIFVFKNITAIIYGYVLVAVFGYTVDYIMAGNRQSSQIFIVSKQFDLIAARVSKEVRRGVTLIDGEGWYTGEKAKIVMVVCRKNETSSIFRIIKDCDPAAFITVGSVMGVYGLGFEALKK